MFLALNYCCKALHLRCFASLGYVSEYGSQAWCLQVLKTSSRHILNTCKLSLFWILWSLFQYILHRNKECAKLRASFAFVSCVPHLPTCLTCLRVYVLTCLHFFDVPNAFSFFYVSYVPFFCLTCLCFFIQELPSDWY